MIFSAEFSQDLQRSVSRLGVVVREAFVALFCQDPPSLPVVVGTTVVVLLLLGVDPASLVHRPALTNGVTQLIARLCALAFATFLVFLVLVCFILRVCAARGHPQQHQPRRPPADEQDEDVLLVPPLWLPGAPYYPPHHHHQPGQHLRQQQQQQQQHPVSGTGTGTGTGTSGLRRGNIDRGASTEWRVLVPDPPHEQLLIPSWDAPLRADGAGGVQSLMKEEAANEFGTGHPQQADQTSDLDPITHEEQGKDADNDRVEEGGMKDTRAAALQTDD